RALHRQPHAAGNRDLDPGRDYGGQERRGAARCCPGRRCQGKAGALGRLRDELDDSLTALSLTPAPLPEGERFICDRLSPRERPPRLICQMSAAGEGGFLFLVRKLVA